jgi:hypothetical protein
MVKELTGTLVYKETERVFTVFEHDLGPYLDSLQHDAMLRVTTTLERVRKGFDVDLVTPAIGKTTPDKLAARAAIIAKVLQEGAHTGLHDLDDAEVTQAKLVGPLSLMSPFSDRREDLLVYWSRQKFRLHLDNDILMKAFDRIVGKIKRHTVQPLSIEAAFEIMPKNTNLGSPFHSKSKAYYPELLSLARAVERGGFNVREYNHPAFLYWRGQSQGLYQHSKDRAVWGYPHYISIHELRLQGALLPHLRKLPEFAALVGFEAVNAEITRLFRLNKGEDWSIDFGGFDKTAEHTLITFGFALWREWFTRGSKRLIDYIEDRFINIPLLHPDGIWEGRHGVPSGSGLTNQMDSIIQWLLAEYCAIKLGARMHGILLQGDDGVWAWRDKVKLTQVQDLVSRFGMFLNTDKGGISKDVVYYLQNVHMRYHMADGLCVGVRPLCRTLSGLTGFETPRDKDWRPVDTTFRWIQQVEACREHPELQVLVKLLLQWDRLIRENDIRTLVIMAGGIDELEARQRSKGFPYGKYPLSGIFQFTTVKMIEELKRTGFGQPLVA